MGAFMHFLKGRTDYTVSLELESLPQQESNSVSTVQVVSSFLLGCVKSIDGEVHFSDHLRHSIYKINFSEQSVCLALGIDDDPGQNDGPKESAKLCYPAGLAARGTCT